ncbi:MAG TPA: TadE family protein [Anaerolineales bacterium]|nr:TadE family protein [Anaerolineales bacterium]
MTKRIMHGRGQALIEFAMALPLILIFWMFLFDFGRITYYLSVLNNAAREAARYGIVNSTNVAGITNVVYDMAIGIDSSDLFVTVSTIEEGTVIVVGIDYQYVPVTPLVASLLGGGGGIPVNTQASMLIEP